MTNSTWISILIGYLAVGLIITAYIRCKEHQRKVQASNDKESHLSKLRLLIKIIADAIVDIFFGIILVWPLYLPKYIYDTRKNRAEETNNNRS